MDDNIVAEQTIRNIKEYVESENFNEQTYDQLLVRLNHLNAAYQGLLPRFQEALAAAAEGEVRNQLIANYREMENLYLDIKTTLKVRLNALKPPTARARAQEQIDNEDGNNQENEFPPNQQQFNVQRAAQEQEQVRAVPNMAQPLIVQYRNPGQIENTWGTFSGDVTAWKSFHDKFKATVHDENIPNVFKLQHLLASLKGQAARAFGDWQTTDENYLEAWARLKQLYSRPYQASKELLWKFYNLPKLEHATGGILQKFSNVTHEVIRSLRAMEYNVDHLDVIFVHGIHDRLDPETSKEWELYRKSETPTIQEMLDFLDRQAKALSGVKYAEKKSTNDGKKRASNNRFERNDNKKSRVDDSKSSESKGEKFEQKKGCWLCKEDHILTRCPKIKAMSFYDRKRYVREQELCNNCFKPNHRAAQCLAGPCNRCNVKHNSLLCSENPMNKQTVNNVQVKKGGKVKNESQTLTKRA